MRQLVDEDPLRPHRGDGEQRRRGSSSVVVFVAAVIASPPPPLARSPRSQKTHARGAPQSHEVVRKGHPPAAEARAGTNDVERRRGDARDPRAGARRRRVVLLLFVVAVAVFATPILERRGESCGGVPPPPLLSLPGPGRGGGLGRRRGREDQKRASSSAAAPALEQKVTGKDLPDGRVGRAGSQGGPPRRREDACEIEGRRRRRRRRRRRGRRRGRRGAWVPVFSALVFVPVFIFAVVAFFFVFFFVVVVVSVSVSVSSASPPYSRSPSPRPRLYPADVAGHHVSVPGAVADQQGTRRGEAPDGDSGRKRERGRGAAAAASRGRCCCGSGSSAPAPPSASSTFAVATSSSRRPAATSAGTQRVAEGADAGHGRGPGVRPDLPAAEAEREVERRSGGADGRERWRRRLRRGRQPHLKLLLAPFGRS